MHPLAPLAPWKKKKIPPTTVFMWDKISPGSPAWL